jgi:hypothetical protein
LCRRVPSATRCWRNTGKDLDRDILYLNFASSFQLRAVSAINAAAAGDRAGPAILDLHGSAVYDGVE